MKDELPQGWTSATISDVTERVPNAKPEDAPNKEFGYIDISSVDNSSFRITEVKRFKGKDAPSRARRPIRQNDVLFSNVRTYLRNVALVEPGCTAQLCSTGFTVLRPNAAIDPDFLFRYVLTNDFIDRVTPQQTGTHYPATSDRVVTGEEIALPPLAEQHRIVMKLERLLEHVDACHQRLEKIQPLLKRFRQSILDAACSGNLTADWRESNPGVQGAPSLLEEVKSQRMVRYQGDVAAMKSRGQKAPKLESNEENPDFSDYGLPDLPESWEWSHVAQFGFVRGGKRLPKGEGLVDENTGHPYLRIRDLRNGTVDRSQILYVPKYVFETIRNYTIQRGDVYLTIVGSIGEAGTIPPEFDGANLTENAAKIVHPVGVVPEFLAAWFRSPVCQCIIQQNIHSGGQGKLALFRIEQMPVPLAPLLEQQEIVRRVEKLFTLADQIEARFAEAKKRVDNITQSVLAKAFRGELVSTEYELAKAEGRSFESAEELLERIKGSGIAQKQGAKPHRKSPRSVLVR